MSILIDPKGLLRGQRLRNLSWLARLYYPYLLGMSNFYARLELDYELIVHDLSTIKQPGLTMLMVADFFEEYKTANLAYLYGDSKGVIWCQFDTKVSMRANFPTKEDNASSAPPEEEYLSWLQYHHGDEWQEYNLSGYQKTLVDKRKEAGAAGGKASGQARRSKPNGAPANEPVVDVVVGVDVVVDEVVGVVPPSLTLSSDRQRKVENLSEQDSSSRKKTKDRDHAVHAKAVEFANDYDHLMQWNPEEKLAVRMKYKNWHDLWVGDFEQLLSNYSEEQVKEMVIIATSAKGNQKYFVRPFYLVEKAAHLLEEIEAKKQHDTKMWTVFKAIYSGKMSKECPDRNDSEEDDE